MRAARRSSRRLGAPRRTDSSRGCRRATRRVVGERGLTLSGGQRQRIAIARALLADPRILILDDATSSVDATTEAEIKRGLAEAMEGRTTLVVAHRLSTISLADEIVVMDGGRIVDRGTHDELLDRSPLYGEIAEFGYEDVAVPAARPGGARGGGEALSGMSGVPRRSPRASRSRGGSGGAIPRRRDRSSPRTPRTRRTSPGGSRARCFCCATSGG